ncbi:ABC transporter substrate-binding protein [Lutibacter sp. B2]|nr:ABC transporter substrate-binding protein [Lutibacter sp. B2]
MKNKIIRLLLVVAVIFAFTGCSSDISTSADKQTREVVDLKGRKVTIPKEVDKVISSYMPATNLVFTVGGQDKLVAVSTKDKKNKFFKSLCPNMDQVVDIGGKNPGLNMETVAASNPDVVIMFPDKESENTCKQLEEQGIPAVVIDPENIEDMKKSTLLVGEVLGKEKQAAEVIKYYDDTIHMIENRLKKIPVQDRKKVYMAGGHGLLSTCSKDMYQHFIIEKAGGIDVAGELSGGWNSISTEQLINWNPDIMVSVRYCNEGEPDLIKANNQLESINAVKNDEVYKFPSNLGPWDVPEPKSVLGILWLSKTMYPELFSDIDLKKEFDHFHSKFYGKSFTELGGIVDEKNSCRESK